MGKLYCCATNCHNYSGKNIKDRKVTLHRFPVNKKHKMIWKNRVSRKNWKPTSCSRLCSEHFISLSGPTKEHPLPSIFHHKTFKTTNFDQTTEVLKEINDNQQENTVRSDSETSESDSAENPSFTVDANKSVLDTSVLMHDYCGLIETSTLSHQKNQLTQTDVQQNDSVCIQTIESYLDTCGSNMVSSKKLCDKSTGTTLPFLTVEDLKQDISFYTGLPNKETFYLLFQHLSDFHKCTVPDTGGRPKKMRDIDEFLMVLMRLRLGLLIQDLAKRFNISVSTCSKIFNEWLDLMYEHLDFLVAWPERNVIKENMPDSFKRRYPNCRVIIDCTEIYTETPQSLSNKGRMYSDYKSHMTWKVLIGISPSGVITHVSDLWTGSTSDKQITKLSKLIEKCEPGDAIMGDKGFLIADLCTPNGIHLIIPPLKKHGRLTKSEVEKTRRIANLRIHVERAMERIKNFKIIQGVVPISLHDKVSKIVFVVCALCNLMPPLIQS
ncbi:uncharacterized protein LOC134229407 [Saccostrea cucullata]|uniref:uncharacterized protein LOC134229407 n=4 Tax=Saccostrea cuccullata TaxID=36930 RepID=UPI002ED17DF4